MKTFAMGFSRVLPALLMLGCGGAAADGPAPAAGARAGSSAATLEQCREGAEVCGEPADQAPVAADEMAAGTKVADRSFEEEADAPAPARRSEPPLARPLEGPPPRTPPPVAPKRPVRPRPEPDAVYAVPIANSPFSGPDYARVTLVEASEFACPHCLTVKPVIEELMSEYGSDLKVVYKHFVVHPTATPASIAVCAAGLQNRFEPMADLIWDRAYPAKDLGADNMRSLAVELKLDLARYDSDVKNVCPQLVDGDRAELGQLGVSGVPAIYINGRFISGARPIEQYRQLIDEELANANARIDAGEATLASYYDDFVLAVGKTSP